MTYTTVHFCREKLRARRNDAGSQLAVIGTPETSVVFNVEDIPAIEELLAILKAAKAERALAAPGETP